MPNPRARYRGHMPEMLSKLCTILATSACTVESYGQNALFPVKAAYSTGYICVVESHVFN